jgi:hypothetical protein
MKHGRCCYCACGELYDDCICPCEICGLPRDKCKVTDCAAND